MKYKVLAFDIDGTLTNSKKEITPATKAAIMKAAEQGCVIALATGRPVPGVADYVKELNFSEIGGYVISLNGGYVLSCKDNKVIRKEVIPMEYYDRIYDLSKEHGVTLLTYEGDDVITEDPDNEFVQIEARINKIKARKVDDLKSHLTFEVPKFLMVADGDYLATVEEKVKPQFAGELDIYRSEPFFLEILPMGINKADALELLLKEVGATREELMTFGDGYNDITMIEYAGMGVAMANGNPVIKEKADYVAPSNDEDGIVHVIEKFVLD